MFILFPPFFCFFSPRVHVAPPPPPGFRSWRPPPSRQAAGQGRAVAFLHLANDVMQLSRKETADFVTAFGGVMLDVCVELPETLWVAGEGSTPLQACLNFWGHLFLGQKITTPSSWVGLRHL